MKHTQRVSIGGVAFYLDDDAFKKLDAYLSRLRQHFAQSPESDEIVADIEYRLCELLQMRISNENEVISSSVAQEILDIIGNPSDFGDEAGEENEEETEFGQSKKTEEPKPEAEHRKSSRKKIYRDGSQQILAGVCSGLGHYLRLDPVIIRLIFAVLFFGMIPFVPQMAGGVTFIYILLWIVMPEARTFEDQVKMKGYTSNIQDMEASGGIVQTPYRGSALGRLFRTIVKVFFYFLAVVFGIAMVASLLALIIGFFVYPVEYNIFGVVHSPDEELLLLKLACIVAIILPLNGLFFLTLKLARGSAFTSRNGILIILGVILWSMAAVYVAKDQFENKDKTTSSIMSIKHKSYESKKVMNVSPEVKTLYIEFDSDEDIKVSDKSDKIIYYSYSKYGKRKKYAKTPQIYVERDSTIHQIELTVDVEAYYPSQSRAVNHGEALLSNCRLTDSLLTIKPEWRKHGGHWKNDKLSIFVKLPVDCDLKVDSRMKTRNR